MILVVGSFNLDLVYRCERFPRPGETIAGTFLSGPGGKGSNQAVAAVRSGSAVTFCSAVGKDAFAQQARDFLENEGLNLHLAEYPDTPTGTAGIVVDAKGENQIVVALGANRLLSSQDIPDELIEAADVVVCQFESNRQTTRDVLDRARKFGVRTILNPAPMAPEDAEMIRHADIVVPNETEFSELVSCLHPSGWGDFTENQIHALSDARLHELCRALQVNNVILTLGARGVFVSTRESFKMIPAHRVSEVVDTTGAGDAFCGGLASGLVKYEGDLFAAARFGVIVAALSVTKAGAAQAMPKRDEIEAHLSF